MNRKRTAEFRRWLGRKGIGLGLRILDPESRREFLRKPDAPCFELTYAALRARGYIPKTVVDIGGNRGEWTGQFHQYFPSIRTFPGIRSGCR